MEMVEVKSEKRSGAKTLSHIDIRRGHRGAGHTVEHHFTSEGMGYHPPEVHAFGKDEGDQMLAHVGKTMGVPAAGEAEGETEQMGGEERDA